MKLFKKLSNWLHKKNTARASKQISTDKPVTQKIMTWLEKRELQYQYEQSSPESKSEHIHHLIINFEDKSFEWACVFRINEQNQLVSLFAILPQTLEPSHFAPALMMIALANLNIPFGSIELDPHDGEIRGKISLDAEFMPLTDKALDCHVQGLSALAELMHKIYQDTLQEEEPSPILMDYLPVVETQTQTQFFEPTTQYQ